MPDSCKTISEYDKIVNPWRNEKNLDWREIFLATGLVGLTSHMIPTPPKTAITGCGLLYAWFSDSRAALSPRLCSPVKVYPFPLLARSQGTVSPVSLSAPDLASDVGALLSRKVRPKPLTCTYSIAELKGSFAIPVTSLCCSPSWEEIHLSPCQIPNCATAECISSRVPSA